MKTWLLALATLMIPALSQALVADRLRCTMLIRHVETGRSFKQVKEVYMVRLPMSMNTPADQKLTGASIEETVSAQIDSYSVDTRWEINYLHASKVDASGAVVDGRQSSCMTVDASMSSGNGTTIGKMMCFPQYDPKEDPFQSPIGWRQVDVVDGVPAFATNTPYDAINVLNDGANTFEIRASCRFVGTYL